MTLSGNPGLRRMVKGSESGKYSSEDSESVTVKGMAIKSVIFCCITIVSALLSAALLFFFLRTGSEAALNILLMILALSGVPLIIVAIVIAFVPKTVSVLGFVYCILQGLLMGVISALVDFLFPGIAIMAFMGTCIVLLVSIGVFYLLGKNISSGFTKFVLISFFSFIILESLGGVLSLFLPAFAAVMQNIWIQIIISLVMILWASFMILIDLNNMQQLADNGADKQYEWLAAFSLVTTLMWLYIEVLELLVKLAALVKRN